MNLTAKPIGFRKWIELEQLKTNLVEAADKDGFPETVYSYLSAVFDVPQKEFESLEWDKTLMVLTRAFGLTPPITVPLVTQAPKGGDDSDWDYPGRTWAYYSHILAEAYGWSLEYIAHLGINEALAQIQEVFTSDHLDKEFYYGLSEVAYRYNKSTKKSDYVPMKRPFWMKPTKAKMPKKVRMRRDMLPQGMIKDVSGLPPEFQIEGLITEKA